MEPMGPTDPVNPALPTSSGALAKSESPENKLIAKIVQKALLNPIVEAIGVTESDKKITTLLTNADKKKLLLDTYFDSICAAIATYRGQHPESNFDEMISLLNYNNPWIPINLKSAFGIEDTFDPEYTEQHRINFFIYYSEVEWESYNNLTSFVEMVRESPTPQGKTLLASIYNEDAIKAITDRLKFSSKETLDKINRSDQDHDFAYEPFMLEYELLNQELAHAPDSQKAETSAGREALPKMESSGGAPSALEERVSTAAQAPLLHPQIDTKHTPESQMTAATDTAKLDTKPVSQATYEMFASQFGTDGAYTQRFNNFIKNADRLFHNKAVGGVIGNTNDLLKAEAAQLEQMALEMIKKLIPLRTPTAPLVSSFKDKIEKQIEVLKKQIVHLRLLQKDSKGALENMVDRYTKGSMQHFARQYIAQQNTRKMQAWVKGSKIVFTKPSFWQFGWTQTEATATPLWFNPITREYRYNDQQPFEFDVEGDIVKWKEIVIQEEDHLLANLALSDETYSDPKLLSDLLIALDNRLNSKLPLDSAVRDSLIRGRAKLQKQNDLYEHNKKLAFADAFAKEADGSYRYLEMDLSQISARDPIALHKLSLLGRMEPLDPTSTPKVDLNAMRSLEERLQKTPYFELGDDQAVLANAKSDIEYQILEHYRILNSSLDQPVTFNRSVDELKRLWRVLDKLQKFEFSMIPPADLSPTEELMKHFSERNGLEDELRRRLNAMRSTPGSASSVNSHLDTALQIVKRKSFEKDDQYTDGELRDFRDILAQAKHFKDKSISEKMGKLFAETGEQVLRLMIRDDRNALENALRTQLEKRVASNEPFDEQFATALKIMQENPDKSKWNNIQITAFKNALKKGFEELDLLPPQERTKKSNIENKMLFIMRHVGFSVLSGANTLTPDEHDKLGSALKDFDNSKNQLGILRKMLDDETSSLESIDPNEIINKAKKFVDLYEANQSHSKPSHVDPSFITDCIILYKQLNAALSTIFSTNLTGVAYAKSLKKIQIPKSDPKRQLEIRNYIETLQNRILSLQLPKIYENLLKNQLLKSTEPERLTDESDSEKS